MTRILTLSILVLGLAATAAGCGGGGGSSNNNNNEGTTTLSKSDFAAKITDVCTTGKKKIAKVGASLTNISQLKDVGDKIVDLENEQIDQFKSVSPPDEIKGQVDDFISKAETSRDKLKELVDAAKKSDSAKMASLTPEVASSGTAVTKAANEFGATC